MNAERLQPGDLHALLGDLNAARQHPWVLRDDAICKEFRFPDFVAAFRFMTGCALIAERMDHHPDWRNLYNRVEVSLSTHDAGGVTTKDFALARAMEGLVSAEHGETGA